MPTSSTSNLFDSLKKLIPGYGGYLESEQRRQDDRVTRDFVAARLQECKSALEQHLRPMIEQGKLDAIQTGESLRSAIDLQQSRVRAAMEGYSSWFDAKQVDATALAKVSQLDSELISIVDRLNDAIQPRDNNPVDLVKAAELLSLFSQRFDRRKELLQK